MQPHSMERFVWLYVPPAFSLKYLRQPSLDLVSIVQMLYELEWF